MIATNYLKEALAIIKEGLMAQINRLNKLKERKQKKLVRDAFYEACYKENSEQEDTGVCSTCKMQDCDYATINSERCRARGKR